MKLINADEIVYESIDTSDTEEYFAKYGTGIFAVKKEDIDKMPSAEEESFEWCTGCKEYDQEKHCCHRWTKVIRNTVEEIRGTTEVGEWVIVHGFSTPGGDPVWKCSNCGKGVHVYGVEHGSYGGDIADHQWVACPNCGAVMIGERYE